MIEKEFFMSKKISFILLGLCIAFLLICCDGSGGDSSDIGKASGAKYVVTNSIPDPENLKVIKGKGIEFTVGGQSSHVYKTITFDKTSLDTSGKFTATVDYSLPYGKKKFSDSGTWSRSGSTITINSKSQGGKWTATISSDGKTLEDDGAEPGISGRLIYTKQ